MVRATDEFMVGTCAFFGASAACSLYFHPFVNHGNFPFIRWSPEKSLVARNIHHNKFSGVGLTVPVGTFLLWEPEYSAVTQICTIGNRLLPPLPIDLRNSFALKISWLI